MKGEILGERYQVEQLLGKKAGRRTFLAHDLQSNQSVVIKLLSFSNDFEWDDLKLFEREAETLKSLNHPAIPRYLDYFEVSSDTVKGFALVQNYIEAKTLEQYLKAGRTFTESEVKEIASSLLEILIYLHSQNPPVIHRDIKPSNILLTDRSGNSVGKVYLVDFGSVQTVAAKEGGTMTVVGTYGYMAPEQFGGRAVPASDIYSLGATLIYLVTGSHPADLPQVDLKIEFEDKANVSQEFVEWLKLMTFPSLNRRCGSAIDSLEKLIQLTINNNQIPKFRYSVESNALDKSIHDLVFSLSESFNIDEVRRILLDKKPKNSKIRIAKNKNYIEFCIPSKELKFKSLLKIGVATISIRFLMAGYIIFAFYSSYSLLLTAFICTLILYILNCIYKTFDSITLRLDSQKVNLNRKFLGCKYSSLCLPRDYIKKLVYNLCRNHKNSILFEIWTDHVSTPVIAFNENKFLHKNNLSRAEFEWILYELSEFINIQVLPFE